MKWMGAYYYQIDRQGMQPMKIGRRKDRKALDQELSALARIDYEPVFCEHLLLPFSTGRRCPHLGCALHWNAAEHSWDCACHGSRLDEHGNVLDNPANGA